MNDRAEWLDQRLAAAGLRRTGPITCPHDRPWSTVHTAPTTGGRVWLKAPGDGTAFEVALCDLLARVAPDQVLHPIAVDLDRGWVLLPDGGTTSPRPARTSSTASAPSSRSTPSCNATSPHTGALLSAGLTDTRPAAMPQRFDEAVATITGDRLDAVRARRPACTEWCARLAASPVPAGIDHNDPHPWNVFLDRGRARFHGWGDAVVAHPFASMLVTAAVVRRELGPGHDHSAVRRVRDAYLEVWSDLAPHRQLVTELELACWVGKVARALVWGRALRAQGHDQAREFADAPRQHLTALLADSWSALTERD